MKRLIQILICLWVLNNVKPVRGDLVFADFSNTQGLQLNGYSRVVNNTLRLTDASGFSSGSMFSRDLLQLVPIVLSVPISSFAFQTAAVSR